MRENIHTAEVVDFLTSHFGADPRQVDLLVGRVRRAVYLYSNAKTVVWTLGIKPDAVRLAVSRAPVPREELTFVSTLKARDAVSSLASETRKQVYVAVGIGKEKERRPKPEKPKFEEHRNLLTTDARKKLAAHMGVDEEQADRILNIVKSHSFLAANLKRVFWLLRLSPGIALIGLKPTQFIGKTNKHLYLSRVELRKGVLTIVGGRGTHFTEESPDMAVNGSGRKPRLDELDGDTDLPERDEED